MKTINHPNFRTQVELPDGSWRIDHADPIMLLGSCFAENIGTLLTENKFTCDVNPFGVLYNPLSVAEALTQLCEEKRYAEDDLRCDNGMWYSLMHHSAFADADRDDCLSRINRRLEEGSAHLRKTQWLFITWGTARVYEWKEDGRIVGNCHKLPARMFGRRLLDVDEVVSAYHSLIARIRTFNPSLKVVFTVSPIRHAKDGMHGNQLNKAVLLLAADRLCRLCNDCHYFPAYEILMDELRDYRFYADDMLHPSPLAIHYIWECFAQSCLTPAALDFMKRWDGIRKALAHRPFNPDTEAYKSFLRQILLNIGQLKEKFPYLDVQNEERICLTTSKK